MLLGDLEDGRLHTDLTTELKDVVAELEALSLRKGGASVKGSITLKLSITATQGVIEVVPDLASKTPKMSRQRSIFWSGKDGALVKSDPNQPDLPLRDVNGAAGAMRTVS
jgi:hypothetical protein